MARDLKAIVAYEDWNNAWAAEFNHTYGLIGRGFDKKEKAVKKAKSEAQMRANSIGKPVEVKIYKMDGTLQDTVTKNPK